MKQPAPIGNQPIWTGLDFADHFVTFAIAVVVGRRKRAVVGFVLPYRGSEMRHAVMGDGLEPRPPVTVERRSACSFALGIVDRGDEIGVWRIVVRAALLGREFVRRQADDAERATFRAKPLGEPEVLGEEPSEQRLAERQVPGIERTAQTGIARNRSVGRPTAGRGELGNASAESVDDDDRLALAAEMFDMVASHRRGRISRHYEHRTSEKFESLKRATTSLVGMACLSTMLQCNTAAMRIAVIDESASRASVIEEGLAQLGESEIFVLTDRLGLLAQIERIEPDVVLIDLGNPSRDVLEEYFAVSRAVARPIAMFVDQSDDEMIGASIDAGVSVYVVDGLASNRIRPVLDLAVRRFNAFARLQADLADARGKLAERETIDRAKRILMDGKGITEPEAYAELRRKAMSSSRRIAEIAEAVVTAHDLLGGKT